MKLFTHTYGQGRPLLALHAAGADGRTFKALAQKLPERQVVAPDLPGHGRSAPPTDSELSHPVAYMALVDGVLPILDKLAAGGPVDLVGHSVGGLVALHLALLRPRAVAGLTIYEPVAFGALAPSHPDVVYARSLFARWNEADPMPWLEAFFGYWGTGRGLAGMPPAHLERIRARAAWLHREAHSVTFCTYPDYASLAVPLQLLVGTATISLTTAIAEGLADLLPEAGLTKVPGV